MDAELVRIFLLQNVNRCDILLDNDHKAELAHTLPFDGPGNIQEVFEQWKLVANEISGEAFCQYINDKRKRGEWDYYALTKQQYFQLSNDYSASFN